MEAVVVGGAGFVGAHLVERLLADGHAVDVVDNLSSGALTALATARAAGGTLRINTLDAASAAFADLVAMRRPQVIYHLATLTPRRSNIGELAARTAETTISVLDAARHADDTKVVVMLPAAELYGEVSAREQPIKEARGWQPSSVAGVIARTVLELLTLYREQHSVEFTALLAAPVYGPRQRAEQGVVAQMIDARRARSAVAVTVSARQVRDLLYIDDAVDALVRAATHAGGLPVNIGTGIGTSYRDLWELLGGKPADLRAASTDDGVGRMVLNATRARLQLGWSSWTSLRDGLIETMAIDG